MVWGGGGRGVQDGEHMYTCGGFIWPLIGKEGTQDESKEIKVIPLGLIYSDCILNGMI